MTVAATINISDVAQLTAGEATAAATLLGLSVPASSGTATTGGTTPAASPPAVTLLTGVAMSAAEFAATWPANAANAPVSPEGSFIKIVNGQIGAIPYLVHPNGTVASFAKDGSGNFIPVTDSFGTGYQLNVGGTLSLSYGYNVLQIAQGGFWFSYDSGHTGRWESATACNSGILQGPIPPYYTAGTTTTPLPAMPTAPTPVSPAPGSVATTTLFGPGQTATTLALGAASAVPGGTLAVSPAATGVVFAESVAVMQPIVLNGGGIVTTPGLASAAFAGGAVIDGQSLADTAGYAHQLGGLVLMTDAEVKGFEVRGFGVATETSSGGTGGIRNGAPGNFSVADSYIHANQDGISSGGFPATWSVSNTLLVGNGIGNGGTHNIYFSTGCVSVTLTGVTSIVAPIASAPTTTNASGQINGGHALKSRANMLTVKGGYYAAADASCIDIPDGTTQPFVIDGATLVKNAGDANHTILGYGVESQTNGMAGGSILNTTFLANCDNPEIITNGGTITIGSGCIVQGKPITITGGGTVLVGGKSMTTLPVGTL